MDWRNVRLVRLVRKSTSTTSTEPQVAVQVGKIYYHFYHNQLERLTVRLLTQLEPRRRRRRPRRQQQQRFVSQWKLLPLRGILLKKREPNVGLVYLQPRLRLYNNDYLWASEVTSAVWFSALEMQKRPRNLKCLSAGQLLAVNRKYLKSFHLLAERDELQQRLLNVDVQYLISNMRLQLWPR